MGSGEDFCLKWNDHHSIFFSLAESLCRSSQLTDVTLATSDQTFPAHKLVLSVCSSFFRDLFSKPELSTVNQSVVYLKDVSSKQLDTDVCMSPCVRRMPVTTCPGTNCPACPWLEGHGPSRPPIVCHPAI